MTRGRALRRFLAVAAVATASLRAVPSAWSAPPRATVNRVDWATTPGGAKVSIQVGGGEVRWSGGRAAANPAAGLPERAFVDIRPAALAASLTRAPVVIDKGILKRLRVGQNDPETVRVAIEVASPVVVSIRGEKSPPRIVVELRTDRESAGREGDPAGVRPGPPPVVVPGPQSKSTPRAGEFATSAAPAAAPTPTFPARAMATPTPTFPAWAMATPTPTFPAWAMATPTPTFPAWAMATPTPTFPARAMATPTPTLPARVMATPTPTFPAWAMATPTPTFPAWAMATPTPTFPAWAVATPTPLAPAGAGGWSAPAAAPTPSPAAVRDFREMYGGGGAGVPPGDGPAEPVAPPAPADEPAARHARGHRVVVLDPGHGGKDPGAQGLSDVEEKRITLAIARLAAARLRKLDPTLKVLLTRGGDTYVALKDRTAFANAKGADLFVSIHVNAAENEESSGIETYTLNNSNDRATKRLAAMENGLSEAGIEREDKDLAWIVSDLLQTGKEGESIVLADSLQRETLRSVRRKWSDTESLGVKKGPFFVLVGAYMPCALVETGFLTHRREASRLATVTYQEALADGIARGIHSFLASGEANSNL